MQGKTILVTGGCGSFGKEFIRDILTKDPRQIRVFSRDEFKQAEMKEEFKDSRIEYLCGDVRDVERLNMALEGVDVCVHAAAMKRIEKCEKDPQEAIKTNVEGSVNVANACLRQNVSHAILISTDKACYPVNLYGATKLAAEKVWIQSNTYRGKRHPTKFSVVRYGNVLGSRGSVLHIFRDQLDEGVIKVTDQRMTRFFITLQEAVDLVQLAIETHQGGEIFIPRLKSASIFHLAQLVAGSAPVEISNQRGGEKLHECLVTQEEKERMASFDHFNIVNPEIVNVTWPYECWESEHTNGYAESSEHAEQFTDDELTELLRTSPLATTA
jgi:UDP-N-acetylglucosamine 4,6-dehydratase